MTVKCITEEWLSSSTTYVIDSFYQKKFNWVLMEKPQLRASLPLHNNEIIGVPYVRLFFIIVFVLNPLHTFRVLTTWLQDSQALAQFQRTELHTNCTRCN